jgi:hypothetical protein
MSGRPEELERLDEILGSVRIAHETGFELSRLFLTRESAASEVADLLAESARIAIVELPRLLGSLRRLALRWEDENLLDPETAARTAAQIATEMEAVEPAAESLLRRHREVVAKLRELTRP